MTQNQIRNFAIISHIDHGKSTLADRFLELTQTIEKRKMREQYLDMMDLEREKGITIKLQPVKMEFYRNQKSKIKNQKENEKNKKFYILNLIDTPGHVDFSYEVSRSLAAVEGVILLVDATKGIQAQTLANLNSAKEQNLSIIPVINKIDLTNAQIEETKKEMANLLDFKPEEILLISAKKNLNIEQVLEKVIEKIPPPKGEIKKPFRALIFDSQYDPFKGVITYVRVVDGSIKKGEEIYLMISQEKGEVLEIGYFKPDFTPVSELQAGEIGYIATGVKNIEKCRVGDTIINAKRKMQKAKVMDVEPLPGYQEPKPVVFASFYLNKDSDFDFLKEALIKIKLNDASLSFEPERLEGLGRGFRCGFLGTLHLEIIEERLKREYGLSLVITSPSIPYKIVRKGEEKEEEVFSPAKLPPSFQLKEIKEPWIGLEIITPFQYLSQIMNFLKSIRGKYKNTQYLGVKNIINFEIPLSEIIGGFYNRLKSITSGYASFSYKVLDWRPADLVKINILVAGKKVEAFSRIVPKDSTYSVAKSMLKRLKEILPPQLFSVSLQAEIEGRIIARENIKALRKDVTASLYGGDYTRKRKLLEKQKKGKKKLKTHGGVNIPPEVFISFIKN